MPLRKDWLKVPVPETGMSGQSHRPSSARLQTVTQSTPPRAGFAVSTRPVTARARMQQESARTSGGEERGSWAQSPKPRATISPSHTIGRGNQRVSRSAGGSLQVHTRISSPPAILPIRPSTARVNCRSLSSLLIAEGKQTKSAVSERCFPPPRNMTGDLLAAMMRERMRSPRESVFGLSSRASPLCFQLGSRDMETRISYESNVDARAQSDGEESLASSSGSSLGIHGQTHVEWRRDDSLTPSVNLASRVQIGTANKHIVRSCREFTAHEVSAYLTTAVLLRPLASLDKDELVKELDLLVYYPGENIVHQGNRCMHGMYFFVEGLAHAQKTSLTDNSTRIVQTFRSRRKDEEQEEQVVSFRGHDDDDETEVRGGIQNPSDTTNLWQHEYSNFFGEFALWKQQPVSCSVVCETECKVVRIHRDALERLGVFEDVVQGLHVMGICQRKASLRLQFEAFDGNRDGLLTLQESWSLMRALGCDYSLEEFQQGFPKMNSAWCDELSYEDFFAFWDTCSVVDPFLLRIPESGNCLETESGVGSLVDGPHEECEETSARADLLIEKDEEGRISSELQADAKSCKGEGEGEFQQQTAEKSDHMQETLTALGNLLNLLSDTSAMKSDKLAMLSKLREQGFSGENSRAGGTSTAIVQDRRCLDVLLKTMEDESEDKDVRDAAAGVLRACLQSSETAATIFLQSELNSKAGVERAEWRASSLASIAPDIISADSAIRSGVFTAFNRLVAQQPRFIRPPQISEENVLTSCQNLTICEVPSGDGEDLDGIIGSKSVRLEDDSDTLQNLTIVGQEQDKHIIEMKKRTGSAKGGVSKYLTLSRQDPRQEFEANCEKFDKFLLTIPDFVELDDQRRGELASIIEISIFKQNDVICSRGDRGRSWFFVLYKGSASTLDQATVETKSKSRDVDVPDIKTMDLEPDILHSTETGKQNDALSEGGRQIFPGEVFGWEALARAQHAHTVLEESITCVATSKMCTVLRIPYEAYVMLLQGLTLGEGVMNNQQDRACKIKSIFLKLDVNGDGVLDAHEINTLCNYMGIQCDLELAHRLCSLIGRTEDHMVSLEQFSEWWESLNVFHVETDINAQNVEEELERTQMAARHAAFDRSRELDRQAAEDSTPTHNPVTFVYDIHGRKHCLVDQETKERNTLPQVLETFPRALRSKQKMGNESKSFEQLNQHFNRRKDTWRDFLPNPDPEQWGWRMKETSFPKKGSQSPRSAVTSPSRKASSALRDGSPMRNGRRSLNTSPMAAAVRGSKNASSPLREASPLAAVRGSRMASSPLRDLSPLRDGGMSSSPLAAARGSPRKMSSRALPRHRPTGEINFPFPDLIADDENEIIFPPSHNLGGQRSSPLDPPRSLLLSTLIKRRNEMRTNVTKPQWVTSGSKVPGGAGVLRRRAKTKK